MASKEIWAAREPFSSHYLLLTCTSCLAPSRYEGDNDLQLERIKVGRHIHRGTAEQANDEKESLLMSRFNPFPCLL